MKLKVAPEQPSLARVAERDDRKVTVGLVQMHWTADPHEHLATLSDGVATAASAVA